MAKQVVAVRIWDWSEWCRQVLRGVRRFAHDHPRWRCYADVGPHNRPQGNLPLTHPNLNGIISAVVGDVRGWKRVIGPGKVKVVAISASIPAGLASLPRVQIDDARVARSIGEHFMAGGFKRLAYFGTDVTGTKDRRLVQLRDFAEANQIPFEAFKPTRTSSVGQAAIARWLQRLPKPVGVAAWNIDLARRVIGACNSAGIAVPEEVAVVAWDDDPMLAETFEPSISGAVLPAELLGYEAARLLDQLMAGETPASPVIVHASGVLHIRQSSDVSTLKNREVYLALQYIQSHFAEPMKVTTVANALNISRKKLEMDFSRVLKQTPYEVISKVRIEQATRLLLETDWGIAKIADRSGIGSACTLRRLFQEQMGMSPGTYREKFTGL